MGARAPFCLTFCLYDTHYKVPFAYPRQSRLLLAVTRMRAQLCHTSTAPGPRASSDPTRTWSSRSRRSNGLSGKLPRWFFTWRRKGVRRGGRNLSDYQYQPLSLLTLLILLIFLNTDFCIVRTATPRFRTIIARSMEQRVDHWSELPEYVSARTRLPGWL